MEENEIYKRARKRVKKKKEFYQHLTSYIAVNTFLFVLNMVTSAHHLWFIYLMLGWGIGLTIHYLDTFGFPGKDNILGEDWEEREMEKELYKLRRESFQGKDDYIAPTVLDDELELKEFKKLRKDWDDTDFV